MSREQRARLSKIVGEMEAFQEQMASWPQRPSHSRLDKVMAAHPREEIERELHVKGDTFPFETDELKWPEFVDPPAQSAVYFDWPADLRLTSEDLRIDDPQRPAFEMIADPFWRLPPAEGQTEGFSAGQVDWPGGEPFEHRGKTYLPPAAEGRPYRRVIEPYDDYRKAVKRHAYLMRRNPLLPCKLNFLSLDISGTCRDIARPADKRGYTGTRAAACNR
jgi:hypothetical protein